uniref:Integrase n=1 Tax=Strongyloides venezuelensis TaxID=75913 RepID=A0A0K0EYF4_STRVS
MLGVKGFYQSIREFSKNGWVRFPKTGRGRASTITCKDISRLNVTMKRIYTREHAQRFGADVALSNTMLMLENLKNYKVRKLDSKKKRQFEALIEEHLYSISNEEPAITDHKVNFSKVEVPLNFDKIKIHWLCKGDETDKETQEALDSCAYSVWVKLCESFHNSTLPKITFVQDRKHLWEREFEKILKKADYGLNYVDKDKLSTNKT